MNKVHSFLFILNGFILGFFINLGTTDIVSLGTIYFIYLMILIMHLILLSLTCALNKARFNTFIIIFFFILFAITNTFLRKHFSPTSGWTSLLIFSIFSFLFCFKKTFDANSEKIFLSIIIGLCSFSIFIYFYVDNIIFGLNEVGQSQFQLSARYNESLVSLTFNKNYLAKYFFYSSFFVLLYRISKNYIDNYNLILLLLMFIFPSFLASTKLVFAALISSFTYFIFYKTFNKIILYIFVLGALILFFNLEVLLPLIESKFLYFFADSHNSRLSLIANGLGLSLDNFFGSGLYYSREQLNTYTHNTYVELLIAIGPFLFIILFFFIYIKFRMLYNIIQFKIFFNVILFLSLFQAVYFDFFILPSFLCLIAIHEKK